MTDRPFLAVGPRHHRRMAQVHLRKHEPVQDSGSYEVWFDDGRPSKFLYFGDLHNRRLRPDIMTKAQAAEAAQEFARTEREKLEPETP